MSIQMVRGNGEIVHYDDGPTQRVKQWAERHENKIDIAKETVERLRNADHERLSHMSGPQIATEMYKLSAAEEPNWKRVEELAVYRATKEVEEDYDAEHQQQLQDWRAAIERPHTGPRGWNRSPDELVRDYSLYFAIVVGLIIVILSIATANPGSLMVGVFMLSFDGVLFLKTKRIRGRHHNDRSACKNTLLKPYNRVKCVHGVTLSRPCNICSLKTRRAYERELNTA